MMKNLTKIYKDNKSKYHNITNKITSNTDGRNCHHLVVVLNIISEFYNIKNYLEIGVHNGTSMSYVVNQPNKINCIGIDLWGDDGPCKTMYDRDSLSMERTKKNIELNNISSNITLIQGNSTHESTIKKLREVIGDEKIDLLFIDGDHSYEGVKNDFENYEKFVKPDGFIVFDDYRIPAIKKFVDNDINYESFELIDVFEENEIILRKN